jgi:ketosteroid isomerase-like protein
MRRLVMGLTLVVALGCSAPSSEWDTQATASLKAEAEWMLKAIDSGDIAGMVSRMDQDVMVFDIDDKNQPVRATGLDQAKQYMGQMENAMKTQGLKFASSVRANECHANQTMGFCAVEFDQIVASGGQTMGPFKFRGTLIARKVGDSWRWVHWHGSFAEFPKGA